MSAMPFDRNRGALTRRSFLAGISGLAVIVLSGCTVSGSAGLFMGGGGVAGRPRTGPASGDPSSSVTFPRAPLTATSEVTLSEDHFLTDQIVLAEGAQAVPFTRPDGTVEALVTGGTGLQHLRRDPTSTSGWSLVSVPAPVGVVSQAVAGYNSADKQVHALVVVPGSSPFSGSQAQAHHLVLNSNGSWTDLGVSQALSTSTDAAAVLTLSAVFERLTGQLFFFGYNASKMVAWATPNAAAARGLDASIAILSASFSSLAFTVTAQAGKYSIDALGVVGGGLTRLTGTLAPATIQLSLATQDLDLPTKTVLAAGILSGSGDAFAIAVRDTLCLVVDDQPVGSPASSYPLSDRTDFTTFSAPVTSDELLHLYGVSDSTLYGCVLSTSWLPDAASVPMLIPMQAGVTGVAVTQTDTAQSTILVTAADQTLQLLAKTASNNSIWTSTPIHLAAATTQQLSQWRVQISITDANGSPVPALQLSVTADQPVGIWQPGQNTLIGPGTAATFTTDVRGMVTIATPCVALSTAVLTVTADGLAAPVQIDPAAGVHGYLAGSGSLGMLPPLTGEVLRTATTDGTANGPKLAPNLSAAGVDPSVSDQVATAISHTMTIGLGQPLGGGVQSFALSLDGSQTSYQTSKRRNVLPRPKVSKASKTALGSAAGDLSNLWRGIEQGVVELGHLAGELGDDLKTWTLTLSVKIAGALLTAFDVVVTGIEDAIHAINGVLQAIGAAIEDAVAWLRAKILGFLADAVADAQMLATQLAKAPQALSTELKLAKKATDGFFGQQKQHVQAWIASLKGTPALSGSLGGLGGGASQLTSRSAQRLSSRPAKVAAGTVFDSSAITHSAHGNWLFDKIDSYFDPSFGPVDPDLSLYALTNSLTAAGQDIEAAFTAFVTAILSGIEDPKQFASVGVGLLLDAVGDLTDAVLDLLDAIIDDLLAVVGAAAGALVSFLDQPVAEVPLLYALLKQAGVSVPLTYGQLLCLVLVFPIEIAYKIANGSNARLFSTTDGAGSRDSRARLDASGSALDYAAAGVTAWGAFMDLYFDCCSLTKPEPAPVPKVLQLFDFACPITLAGLTWPDDITSIDQVVDGTVDQTMEVIAWLTGVVSGLLSFASTMGAEKMLFRDTAIGWMINGGCGIFGLVCGAIASAGVDGGPSSGDGIALAVTGNLSLLLAPLMSESALKSTEMVSGAVKLVACSFAGLASAGLTYETL